MSPQARRSGDRSDRRRSKGTPVDVIAARTKNQRKTPEGIFGRVAPPSTRAVRRYLDAGLCPWCGRGPYKVVSTHVVQAHGVGRVELRELAGLKKHDSICDPAYSKQRSEWAIEKGLVPPTNKKGAKVTYTTAGREAQRANGRRNVFAMSPERRREGGAKGGKVRGEQLKKPRGKCMVCGDDVPYVSGQASKKTCSPACRTAARSQAMARWRRQVSSS